jgi:hypothetical protein
MTFMQDMTEDEKKIMHQHVTYWAPYIEDETVLVLGPVFDPAGGYGIAIVGVENEDQLMELIKNDPASAISHYEWHPMRAVTKNN